ncbi:MAG: Holliday junction branch migration protein RuvA [Anaerolineales bacterium]|jgi:Holliday junction DNA helicase RuvA|nr:Holliday junction branch migration protein RuvA [Anaerolineales bacterium]
MIASLLGKVQEVLNDSLVILVGGGVGLQVYVPNPTRDRHRAGDAISLSTYLVVRQDLLALYGFETREERDFFSLLLGVDGIGPKLALGVLSVLSPDAIRRAVFHEQADVFSRVPGVGKKTAQKILLQLQDKIQATPGLEPFGLLSDLDAQVIDALTALGYSVVEAQAAVQSIPRTAPEDLEERLRLALQYFA